MDYINNGDSVRVAASKAGMSRASGYNIFKESRSGGRKPRARTRRDPQQLLLPHAYLIGVNILLPGKLRHSLLSPYR